MKVRLTHSSHAKKFAGQPGDIVDVPNGLGALWIARGGAVLCGKPKPTVEVAARAAPETAAVRTAAPDGR